MRKRLSLLAALLMSLSLASCSLPNLTPPTETPTPSDTPTPTATHTPSRTPAPTLTPSDTPTPTETHRPSHTPTPTMTPTLYGIVNARQRINVRNGPGTRYGVIASLAPGEGAQVIGQSDARDWYQVRLSDDETGWVSAALLLVQTPTPIVTPEPTADYTALLDMPIVDLPAAHGTATAIAAASVPTDPPDAPVEAATEPPAEAPVATPRRDVNVFAFCDDPGYGMAPPVGLTSGSTIRIYWGWFASSEAQVWQHIEHAQHDLRVNGQAIANVDSYRIAPRQDGIDHVVYWYVPYGPLAAGTYEIRYRVSWRQAISDGYAHYGPGAEREVETESCRFSVR